MMWRNAAGVTVTETALTKIGSAGWNAGAIFALALTSGEGGVEFTAPEYFDRVVGFGYSGVGPGHNDIPIGLHLTDGGLRCFFHAG